MNNELSYIKGLQEQYEDALFALMMHKFAEKQGEIYMAENERLMEDPSAAMPKDVERRCLETIDRELSRRKKKHAGTKVARIVGRYLIAAIIVMTLICSAVAFSDNVRAGVMNLLLQMDEKAATWQIVPDMPIDALPSPEGESEMPDIEVAWVPDGFSAENPVKDRFRSSVQYKNDKNSAFEITVIRGDASSFSADVEDADSFAETIIQGKYAQVIEKHGELKLVWADSNKGLVFSVKSATVDQELIQLIAEGVTIAQ